MNEFFGQKMSFGARVGRCAIWRLWPVASPLLFNFHPQVAQAQDSPATAPTTQAAVVPVTLPPVVVTASRILDTPTSPSINNASVQRRQVPGGLTLRDASAMDRGRASNFDDLLGAVPGLITQSENGTEVSKVSIRGSGILSEDEPLGVQFLLDGFTYNQGDGEVILEDFNVGAAEYAEVFRGAAGFKYGANTLGGAINLVSKTGYDTDPFQLRLEAGSYGFARTQVSSGGVFGSNDYYASFMARHRDGFRDHSREDTQLFFANFGGRLTDTVENRFYVTLDETSRQLPGGITKGQMLSNPKQADPFSVAQDWNKQWQYVRLADKVSYRSGADTADAGVYWWRRDLENRGFYSPDFPEGIDSFHADNFGLLLDYAHQGSLGGRKNILSVGFSPQLESQTDQTFQNLGGHRGSMTSHHTELSINAPLYAEDQQYLTDRLSLVLGLQAIFSQRQYHDLSAGTDGRENRANLLFYGLNPKAGVIYELNPDSQVFASISRSWQPPSFDNMLDFGPPPHPALEFTPLSPQHAWTIEVGTRGEDGRVKWDLSLYHSWVRDELLELNDVFGNDRGAVNIGRSTHQGIEAGLTIDLLNNLLVHPRARGDGDHLALTQTYTLNDLRFDADPVYFHNRIAGIPIHLYQASLLYETSSGFYAGPNLQWNITPYPVDQANTLSANPYLLLGFKIGYRPSPAFTIFFEARNLTDERYAASIDPIPDARVGGAPMIFHPGDGRSFYGGVSWSH